MMEPAKYRHSPSMASGEIGGNILQHCVYAAHEYAPTNVIYMQNVMLTS